MTDMIVSETADLAIISEIPPDRQPARVYLASLSEGSRRTMSQSLATVAGLLTGNNNFLDLAWWGLRYQHVAAIRSRLMPIYAPATVNKILAAVRGVLREAWRLGLVPEAEYRKAIDVPGVRGHTLPVGRSLTPGEIGALLDVCVVDPAPSGYRDAAIVAVLYGCGLRRSEICSLEVSDYDGESIRIRRGKGQKERSSPIADGTSAAVEDWLSVRGSAPGSLFVPIGKAGRLTHRRLSSQAIYNILQKRGTEAGVAHFTPHDLRRSLISHLLEAGADLVVVSKVVGHSSVVTTARYDRRGETAKKRALELLHIPYSRHTRHDDDAE